MSEIAPALLDETRLVEQLIALKDQLLVPGSGKGQAHSLLPQPPIQFGRCLPRPQMQTLLDRGKRRRPAGTPVLPWEKPVPVLPERLGGSARTRFTHQRQIGDGQGAARSRLASFGAITVAKGVE